VLPTKFLAATEDERLLGIGLSANDDCRLPLEAIEGGPTPNCEQILLNANDTKDLFALSKLQEELTVFMKKGKANSRAIAAPDQVVRQARSMTTHVNLGKADFFELKMRELIVRDRTLTYAEPDESVPTWNARITDLVFGDEKLGGMKRPEEASTGETKNA